METYSFFPRAYSRRIFLVASTALAIGLMSLSARGNQRNDAFSCYGLLGNGYPSAFLCDYSDGGNPIIASPENSVEQIDETDFPYFSLQGVFVDIVFYELLILLVWFAVTYPLHLVQRKSRENEE